MSTSVAAADWIKRIADEERKRDAARVREEEIAARKSDLVRLNGQRLIDDLRATITRDLEAFRNEFPGDATREVTLEGTESGGFVVRKMASPAVVLTVAPNLDTASRACHFRFALRNNLPPREDRVELVLARDGAETLLRRHQGTGQDVATASGLSTFLAAPVVPTAAGRVLRLGPCFVDRESARAHLMLVQLGDGLLGLFVRAHLHERESARAAGGHVAHHLHRLDVSCLGKQLL